MALRSIFGGKAPSIPSTYIFEHDGQREVSQALRENFRSQTPAAIVEIIASRGWGKTLYFCGSVLAPYLDTHPSAKVMWVAPTYLIAMSPVDDVFKGIDETTGQAYIPEFDDQGNRRWQFSITSSGPMLKWWNGATVVFRSADSPDSIVSKGFNLIILDEACLIEEKVFTQQILGTARKAGIKIFMISSPRGKKHWTYKIFVKGQDATETQYLSFQQPYHKNPYFNKTLEVLIKDIPEWLYRQEYLAEFIDDGDSVFRGLESILLGPEIQYEGTQQEWTADKVDATVKTFEGDVLRKFSERRFVVGLDLAKSVDYTVFTVMDCETGDMVYYRRMNKTDYREVLSHAASLCKEWNSADLIFDATGVGAGLADMLNNYDIVAHPYVFTNESKCELVNRLAIAIEYQEIKLPNIQTIKNELSVFTYTLTRTGKISYNAPPGFHDDIVMSLALSNWYRKENHSNDEVGVLDSIIEHNSANHERPGSFMDYMQNDND